MSDIQQIIEETLAERQADETLNKRVSVYLLPGIRREGMSHSKFIEKVCKQNGISVEDVKSERKDRHISDPRRIIMYILCNNYGYTRKITAKILNKGNQSTITNGIRAVEGLIETDKRFRQKFDRAKALIEQNIKWPL